MGPTQLKKVMEEKDHIKFSLIGHLLKLPANPSNTSEVGMSDPLPDHENDGEIHLDAGIAEGTGTAESESLKPAQKNPGGKGRPVSRRRRFLVPVYALIRNNDEDGVG